LLYTLKTPSTTQGVGKVSPYTKVEFKLNKFFGKVLKTRFLSITYLSLTKGDDNYGDA